MREVLSFCLDEVSLMSALGSRGCVAFHAMGMAFKGWSVSLLIRAGKAMDISTGAMPVCDHGYISLNFLLSSSSYWVWANAHVDVRWCC